MAITGTLASPATAQANENKIRLTALWVFILTLISIWAPLLPVAVFLSADFFLRAFGFGKYSPLSWLSNVVVSALSLGNKPIYFAPKIFAARVGFVLALVAVAGLLLQAGTIVLATYIIFSFFAFLESFLGFCAGCYVYYLLTHIKLIKP
ncbi:MAG TPA: DUF4395 domain-containing protein [Chitinophagaceae bacterium]|nr:DUF4395 domain-containing protein [Chitinophagaceae bacterium]